MQTIDKYLIIGAGFIGLGMAEALQTAGLAYDQVDARMVAALDDPCGHSPVLWFSYRLWLGRTKASLIYQTSHHQ